MDLAFRPLARQSDHSGRPFAPGERVVSFLVRAPTGEIGRIDLGADEAALYQPAPGALLCRWSQLVRTPDTTTAASRRQQLQSAEEMFLSLCAADSAGSDDPPPPLPAEAALLRHLLALQLERRRVLRGVGPGLYLHVRLRQTFPAPAVELTPAALLAVQEQLGVLVS
jgi:hypothetical protein